jgi:hypothetical protein
MTCPIRSTQDGYRCAACNRRWDRDDEAPPCPRQLATRAHDESIERSNRYVSALAPSFVDKLQ